MRRLLTLILALLLLLTACGGGSTSGESDPPPNAAAYVQEIGQGETVFRFEATDNNDVRTAWNVHTNEETVGAALVAIGLISGDETDFGLMVTEVNGVIADWDANQAFWAFYINGEFAMTGADATYIEPGATYAFVYTEG